MDENLRNEIELQVRRLFKDDAGMHREYLESQLAMFKQTTKWISIVGAAVLFFFLGNTYLNVESTVKSAVEQRMIDYKLDEHLQRQLQVRAQAIIDTAGSTIAAASEKEIKSKVGAEASRVLNESLDEKIKELRELDLTKAILPPGSIVAWTGDKGIPTGWLICDGKNGTPDLRGRFVLGADDLTRVGETGGAASHVHGARFTGSRFEADNIGSRGTGATRHDDNRIVVENASSMPPYTTLVYIIKQ